MMPLHSGAHEKLQEGSGSQFLVQFLRLLAALSYLCTEVLCGLNNQILVVNYVGPSDITRY